MAKYKRTGNLTGKNKPSIAQSLEVIFEIVTENTESIKSLASIQIEAMHKLDQTTKKVYGSLISKEYANQMNEKLKEQDDHTKKLQKLIFEEETKKNVQTLELQEHKKSTMFYFYLLIFAIILILFLGYQFWKERKILASKLEVIEIYESFIKEERLEQKFRIYIEK